MGRAEEVLAAGRLKARICAPYFRALLLSFITRPMPGLGTVGCTKRGIFFYDPEWVAKRTVEEMAGLWLHEALHRLNLHADRCGARDPEKFNMAGDFSINTIVVEIGAKLPDGDDRGLFPEDYGWKKGLTAEAYYELMRKPPQKGKGREPQRGKGKGKGDPQDGEGGGAGEPEDGAGRPKCGAGWCGSCAGRPIPGEPPEAEGRSDAENSRINRTVAQAIREQATRSRGSVPAGLVRWSDDCLKPAKIPWRTKLARIVRGSCAHVAGAVDHRWDGPGRRQAGLGFGPGRPVMPRLRAPRPRVAAGIDTSGSMGQDELASAIVEVNGVLKAVGAEITFFSVDAKVHGIGKVRRIEDAIPLCKGGGGTDFRPAFDAIEKLRPRPDVVVFATDGQGPAPTTAPRGMKVIWVLIGPYKSKPCDWGEFVEVEDD